MPGIVTNPTAGDIHVNVPLTNFSQKYMQDNDKFVGMGAVPNLPVAKQSDLYYEFSRADFFRDQAEERADGTESAGGGFKVATDPYFARVYAFHKDVTDRQRANQDAPIMLDNSATQFVSLKLMIRRERVFQGAIFNASTWSGSSTGADIDTDWRPTGASTVDPIIQIRNEIRSVHQRTGMRPNKMLIGRQAWDTLLDNDDILSRITGGATAAMPAMVMRQLIAALFEVDEIFVMDAVVNTGAEQAQSVPVSKSDLNLGESNSFIGGDNALLYYAPDSVGLEEPTAAVQFSWTGFLGATENGMRIRRFRHEPTQADRIEGEMAFDYKVVAPELGVFFTSVSS
jgi:hypothetical protein